MAGLQNQLSSQAYGVPIAPAATTECTARRRLMLFTDSFVHGGSERQFVQTLRHLDRTKYDIKVGCLKKRGPFLAEVESLGLPVIEFPITSLRQIRTVREFKRLIQFLRAERIELLHSFEYYSNAFAVPAARLAGVAAVASRRSLRDTVPLPWVSRLTCAFAHGIVANSRTAATVFGLREWALERVTFIPNSVDAADYETSVPTAELRGLLGLPKDCLLVGMLSALREEKDHATFLRAAAAVRSEVPETEFVVIGDGPLHANLENLARELGMAGAVHFVGDQANVADWLHALDIVVLTSRTESLPNCILEAMAAGRPVVATQVGGVPEVVEHGTTGFLAAAGDTSAIAASIVKLLRDPNAAAAMGAAGRQRIEREFTPEKTVARLERLYDRLLRERQPAARIVQIGNYPPPFCGWSQHTKLLQEALAQAGADSRVIDIGPSRELGGRDCVPIRGGLNYAWQLVRHRARGFTFHVHVNGDSWKGYVLAMAAVLLASATRGRAVLTFHAGPKQIYFPRTRGFWHLAFRALFHASESIICNHEPVKASICRVYDIEAAKVHAIPAFTVQYAEDIPVPLPAAVEHFLANAEPRLFCYSLFRPEFEFHLLLEAFSAIRRQFPRAGLLVVGSLQIPDVVHTQLERLGIGDAILFAGNLSHAEFLTVVQRSDVFIRTHLRDGVCSSVLEALFLGVPVVAAEDGQRPASVVCYRPGSSAELASALSGVLSDLKGAKARVQPPEVSDNLAAEVAVVMAAAGVVQP